MEEEIQIEAVDKLLKMYNKMENDILLMLARHFLYNEEFLNSDYWRIQKLEELGLFNEEVIKYIASFSNSTPSAVKKALQEIGIKTYNYPKLSRAFEDEQLSVDPNTLLLNGTVQRLINTQYNELSNSLINMSYKIQRNVRQVYLNIVEQTYLKTVTGTTSYGEAIREAINELGNTGLKTLTYITQDETGEVIGTRTYDVEGAVRREILTNTRNLSNSINNEVIEELQPTYVKLSEHLQCRPQHFSWQGTIVKASEWKNLTHYGEVDGLGGINCKHYVEPYFGDNRGKEEKKYTQEQCDKQYTLEQKQRYLERGVRTWKRKVDLFKENKDIKAMQKSKAKLKLWNDRYLDFCNANDIQPDYTRTYARIK